MKNPVRIRTIRLIVPGKQKNQQYVKLTQIAQAVASYRDDAKPPVTMGHPEKGADRQAAYGRVANPRIEKVDGEDSLVLEIWYTARLAKLEDNGDVADFSGGLYPHPKTLEYYIHHVAALGGLPGAADTKTLDVVELADIDESKMITLSAEVLSTIELTGENKLEPDEIAKIVADAVGTAVKPLQDRLAKLENPADKSKRADKGEQDGDDKTTAGREGKEEETTEQPGNKELAAVMGIVKSDRINSVKAAGKEKGLTDKQMKPLVDRLEAAEAFELANNEPTGLYQSSLEFICGLNGSNDESNTLFQPLELSNPAGKGDDKVDFSQLATKM